MAASGEQVLRILETAGFRAYFVGGCVRDELMGRPVHDMDIATSAGPDQVMELFERTAPTGLAHGTVTVLMEGQSFEVTTFRKETGYKDHRRPSEVQFVDGIEEDLQRRDFTMNAIAMDLDGRLVDPYGGRRDIEHGWIRCVGKAEERFEEDALRMLRAIRFASVFGFKPLKSVWRALLAAKGSMAYIAAERIRSELERIVLGPLPQRGLALLARSGLLASAAAPLPAGCAPAADSGDAVRSGRAASGGDTPVGFGAGVSQGGRAAGLGDGVGPSGRAANLSDGDGLIGMAAGFGGTGRSAVLGDRDRAGAVAGRRTVCGAPAGSLAALAALPAEPPALRWSLLLQQLRVAPEEAGPLLRSWTFPGALTRQISALLHIDAALRPFMGPAVDPQAGSTPLAGADTSRDTVKDEASVEADQGRKAGALADCSGNDCGCSRGNNRGNHDDDYAFDDHCAFTQSGAARRVWTRLELLYGKEAAELWLTRERCITAGLNKAEFCPVQSDLLNDPYDPSDHPNRYNKADNLQDHGDHPNDYTDNSDDHADNPDDHTDNPKDHADNPPGPTDIPPGLTDIPPGYADNPLGRHLHGLNDNRRHRDQTRRRTGQDMPQQPEPAAIRQAFLRRAESWHREIKVHGAADLAVTAGEIMEASGRKGGPWLGQLMKELVELTAIGELENDKQVLLQALKERLNDERQSNEQQPGK